MLYDIDDMESLKDILIRLGEDEEEVSRQIKEQLHIENGYPGDRVEHLAEVRDAMQKAVFELSVYLQRYRI